MNAEINTGQELPPQPHLSHAQLKELTNFVQFEADRGQAGIKYAREMSRMDQISEAAAIDSTPGRVAIAGASLGANVRSKVELMKRESIYGDQLQEMGMPEDHVARLKAMQHEFAQAPGNPGVIAESLSKQVAYLKEKEDEGETVALSKIAYLSSAFSATRDHGLRRAIYKDLQNLTRGK